MAQGVEKEAGTQSHTRGAMTKLMYEVAYLGWLAGFSLERWFTKELAGFCCCDWEDADTVEHWRSSTHRGHVACFAYSGLQASPQAEHDNLDDIWDIKHRRRSWPMSIQCWR